MTKAVLFWVMIALSVLIACKKDDPEPYLKHIRYEVVCDSCQASYIIGITEMHMEVDGTWQRSFDIHESQYLFVRLFDYDAIGTSSAKVFVNDVLKYAKSNTGALDTLVQASGYP